MKSLYSFIIKPLNKRYNNEKKIGDKTLIINTTIENHRFVSKEAVVVSVPAAYSSRVKIGDKVHVHHNIFRRWYDQKGRERNSARYFKDDMYFCSIDQIYLYKNSKGWHTFGDRCFIQPIKNNNSLTVDKEQKLVGILKYGNSSLEALEINEGDKVGYTPNGEWEFLVDKERLYCMKSNDIVIKYEYEGNEEKYNPSWSSSS